MTRSLVRAGHAAFGLQVMYHLISIFTMVFGINVIFNELYFSTDIDRLLPLPLRGREIAGAKFGASNQLAENEEQRCISLISRRFYECWTDFNWSENLQPVLLSVRFGGGGKILGYKIVQSSGDAKVDQSVLAAAKRADHVSGLSAEFLKKYPEITISMTPKRQ